MGDLIYCLAAARRNTLPTLASCNVLFNVLDDAKTVARIKQTKKVRDLPRVDEIILDSSGFKLLGAQESNKRITFDSTRPLIWSKTEVNISPSHVVQAGLELGPNLMISLDYPIRKLKNEQERQAEFTKKLPYNIEFAIDTCKLREKYCPHIPLLIAVQAYTINDFMRFEKEIRGLTFDGFSMPVRHASLEQLAYFLFTFSRIARKRFHLLGTSSFLNIALCAYFAVHYFGSVSFDSRGWRLAAEHSKYLNPLNLHEESIQAEDVKNKEHLRSYCSCPVCKSYSLKQIKDYPFPKRTALLREHNVIAIQKLTEELHQNAVALSQFETCLKSRTSQIKPVEELVRVISVVDRYSIRPVIDHRNIGSERWPRSLTRMNKEETGNMTPVIP